MKNHLDILIHICIIVLCIGCIPLTSIAQTYATPELKESVEREMKEKNALLGFTNGSESNQENVVSEKNTTPFDFNRIINLYRLQKVEVIDDSGRHSENEMKAYQLEAQGEYDSKDRAVDMEMGRMYIISKTDATRFGYFDFKVNKDFIESKNCKDCQDSRYEIIEQTATTLVLQIEPQDDWKHFKYQFTFKK